MTFKLEKGETKNYQTCFMVNNEDIKTGKLSSFTKYYLEEMGIGALDGDNELDVNYTFEVTVGNSTASYKEGSIINEDNESNEGNEGNEDNESNEGNEDNESNEGNEGNEGNKGNEGNEGNKGNDTKSGENDDKSDMIKIFKYLILFLILF